MCREKRRKCHDKRKRNRNLNTGWMHKERSRKAPGKGTMVFDDFEKHFDTYMKDWCIEEDELPKYKRMIKEKVPVADWSIVEFEGKTYYIEYVL